MQPAVEVERLGLARGLPYAVPEVAEGLDAVGRGRERIARQPVVKLAVERLKRLVGRAAGERVGELEDRARVGARQPRDNRIDQRARVFRSAEPRERLAGGTAPAFCGGGDLSRIALAPWRPQPED